MKQRISDRLEREIKLARFYEWAMSFICLGLGLFVIAAASRIPHYLETADYVRLIGVIMFGLLVAIGSAINVNNHIYLWRVQRESARLSRKDYNGEI